jgi:4,5-DOPA dioxygenase extradiol
MGTPPPRSTAASGSIVWAVFSPNAPTLIDPRVLGLGGQATLEQLERLNVEARLAPDAILSISPHWVSSSGFLVDDSARPRFIEDYSGFPPQMYGHDYLPPGDPALARLLVEEGQRTGIRVQTSQAWGLDHGAWTVLRPLAPSARIPVVALSIGDEPPESHLAWGRAVARAVAGSGKRIALVATGLILHNFRRLSLRPDGPAWPEGIAIEREILDRILGGDVEGVAGFDPAKWREVAPEGELGPYFILAGATGPEFRPKLLSNERAFGSAGMALIEFTRPK